MFETKRKPETVATSRGTVNKFLANAKAETSKTRSVKRRSTTSTT